MRTEGFVWGTLEYKWVPSAMLKGVAIRLLKQHRGCTAVVMMEAIAAVARCLNLSDVEVDWLYHNV